MILWECLCCEYKANEEVKKRRNGREGMAVKKKYSMTIFIFMKK